MLVSTRIHDIISKQIVIFMKSMIFWDVTPCSLLSCNHHCENLKSYIVIFMITSMRTSNFNTKIKIFNLHFMIQRCYGKVNLHLELSKFLNSVPDLLSLYISGNYRMKGFRQQTLHTVNRSHSPQSPKV
jgi:hypothetical protein